MLGVICNDQPVSAVTEYFTSVPYENAFIADEKATLICEIDQLWWRRFLANNGNSKLTITEAVSLMVQDGAKKFEHDAGFSYPGTRLRRLVPALNLDRRIVEVTVASMSVPETLDACGLVMAGGYGRRLGDLTKTVPKPMLEIAGKPIAGHLVDNFVDNGIHDIYMSVFYLGHVVKDHFGDGSRFNCRIRYLEETMPLGTAGCLSLIGHEATKPVVMINGDVVTNLQLSRVLDYHQRSHADVTMAVRPHTVSIPYGIVEHGGGAVLSIREKPKISYDINVAIYVISPGVLRHVAPGAKLDMPDFIQFLLPIGYTVQIFPMFETWIDVGSVADLARAKETYDPAARPSLSEAAFQKPPRLTLGSKFG